MCSSAVPSVNSAAPLISTIAAITQPVSLVRWVELTTSVYVATPTVRPIGLFTSAATTYASEASKVVASTATGRAGGTPAPRTRRRSAQRW